MIVGTNYTVEANDGSCSSSQSATFTNLAALSTPETPTLLSTPATCLNDGSSTITNYNTNHSYTFNPSGPLVGVGGLISGMITGTNYTVIANDGSCNSLASNNFSNEALTPPPVSPSVSTISPTCTADGVSTIGNYNPNFTYQFSPTGPTVSTAGIILNMTAGTSYTVVANDGSCNSIVSTAFSNAEQLPAPIPEITGELTYCTGSNTTLTASGGTSYSWSSSTTAVIGTNASITLTQGLYTLTATNANGCSASINTIVSEVSLPPAPQLTASPVNCPGDILTLSAEIELGNQINWTGPAGFSSNETTVSFPINSSQIGLYQANQYSSLACVSANATLTVAIVNTYSFDDFEFPNVITANNDGINDKLDIEGIYKTCDSYSIYFFNRWGSLVYQHQLGEEPFKGVSADGNELPDGTYFYKLEFLSGGDQQTIVKSGFVQLIR
jgi:gliding motility-associated-like protein